MSLTYSSMLDLQTDLINFKLHNVVDNNTFSSSELNISKPALIMFICNHCPYVIHYHDEIKKLALDYLDRFNFVAISSNDIENYPQDSPDKMKELWHKLGLDFPYLYDESQEIAKLYGAERTPEFYLLDSNKIVIYRGRMDDSPRDPAHVKSSELSYALDQILSGKEISISRTESIGCSIKWKN